MHKGFVMTDEQRTKVEEQYVNKETKEISYTSFHRAFGITPERVVSLMYCTHFHGLISDSQLRASTIVLQNDCSLVHVFAVFARTVAVLAEAIEGGKEGAWHFQRQCVNSRPDRVLCR